MSNKAVAWAFELEGLTPTQKFLLVALADFADEANSCFPGQATLANRVCATRETVSRNLRLLEDMGAIRRERRHRDDGSRTSDRFVLNLEWPNRLCDESSRDPDAGTYVTQNGSQCDANRGALTIREPSEEPPVLPDSRAFDEFYSIYPRKAGKQAALKAFVKAAKSVGAEVIVAGATRYANDPNLPEKQFIPHPASWLNAGRWDDEPLPPRGQGPEESGNAYDWNWADD